MKQKIVHGFGLIEVVIVIGVIVVIAVGGYYALSDRNGGSPAELIEEGSMMKDEAEKVMEQMGEMMDEKNAMMSGFAGYEFQGTVLAGGTETKLYDFVKADYEAAFASDKLVVLYFYANWCPICKAETRDALYPAFNELTNANVVGFRVNYNDNETDDDERALAKEFGVAYQHTKVFVKDGVRVLKSPESWSKSRYALEIAKFN